MRVRILGISDYLPERIETNEDLARESGLGPAADRGQDGHFRGTSRPRGDGL